MGTAQVVAAQGVQHRAVVRGAEDALDDDVEAVVEGIAGHGVDEADVRRVRGVPLPQHDPAQIVLAHQREAASVAGAQLGGHGGLAGRGVAAQHDQPRRRGTHPHPGHGSGLGVGGESRGVCGRLPAVCEFLPEPLTNPWGRPNFIASYFIRHI
ncbi:hypothetical protein SSPO_073700 [Streptomyces antimycoticus]|uniref:Uncharacterized protein n=1 Tax=Streptomyces antimycoticus TaxID=68175 RepID=A0A499UU36_9ACTN|nr:hypothetical protein SSPO_073700 [Streptomyces antimycoticus]